MVVAVLPAVRTGEIKRRISRRSPSWVECYRFLPHVTRERRIALVHGIGCGRVSIGPFATVIGFELVANPTQTFGSAILLLTPLSSLFCNRAQLEAACRRAGPGVRPHVPVVALFNSGLDILLSGVVAGSIAFGVHGWRAGPRASFSATGRRCSCSCSPA